jgi:hypothetical protein
MNGNEAERVGTEAGVPVPGNGHDGGFGNPRRLNPFANRCSELSARVYVPPGRGVSQVQSAAPGRIRRNWSRK